MSIWHLSHMYQIWRRAFYSKKGGQIISHHRRNIQHVNDVRSYCVARNRYMGRAIRRCSNGFGGSNVYRFSYSQWAGPTNSDALARQGEWWNNQKSGWITQGLPVSASGCPAAPVTAPSGAPPDATVDSNGHKQQILRPEASTLVVLMHRAAMDQLDFIRTISISFLGTG